jgi:hypothetical protein
MPACGTYSTSVLSRLSKRQVMNLLNSGASNYPAFAKKAGMAGAAWCVWNNQLRDGMVLPPPEAESIY